jgi:hypothetical protein
MGFWMGNSRMKWGTFQYVMLENSWKSIWLLFRIWSTHDMVGVPTWKYLTLQHMRIKPNKWGYSITNENVDLPWSNVEINGVSRGSSNLHEKKREGSPKFSEQLANCNDQQIIRKDLKYFIKWPRINIWWRYIIYIYSLPSGKLT